MRIKEIKVYTFNELTPEVQNKIINKFYDINIDHDWWDSDYEDAKNIGLKITEFDIYHGTIKGSFIKSAHNTCELIIGNHGKDCETYKHALNYLADCLAINEWDDKLDSEFLHDLLEDYLSILKKIGRAHV